jgi:hypothetical protein
MKKPKVISANKFFSLLADGNYKIAVNSDYEGDGEYLPFLLKVNEQYKISPVKVKEYRFLKTETNAEINLFAISGHGKIAKIIKQKN